MDTNDQAVTRLQHGIGFIMAGFEDPVHCAESNSPELLFDPKTIRQSILNSICSSPNRTTLPDGTLFLDQGNYRFATMKADFETKRVHVFGYHNGSEMYDGEDAGAYVFSISLETAQALRSRIAAVKNISASEMLEIMGW